MTPHGRLVDHSTTHVQEILMTSSAVPATRTTHAAARPADPRVGVAAVWLASAVAIWATGAFDGSLVGALAATLLVVDAAVFTRLRLGRRGGRRRKLAAVLVALSVVGLAACGGDDDASNPPAPEHPVATFRVDGKEDYKIELTTPELEAHARELLAGGEDGRIPNGVVVRDSPSVNTPWSWHIDPNTVEFVDMTTEVCDGLPSDVEDGTITSDRYCPWIVEIVDIEG
jgi:hypothetical protein